MNNSIIETFQVFNLEAMVAAQNSLIEVKQFIDNEIVDQKLMDLIKIVRTSLHVEVIDIFKPLQNQGQPESIKAFFKDVDFEQVHNTILVYFDKEVETLFGK